MLSQRMSIGILSGFTGILLYTTCRKLYSHFNNCQINEVLFSNPKSGCCNRQNTEKSQIKCPNPYCKSNVEGRILELINSAKHSIYLSMYIFTSKRLGNAIISAYERGIAIRIISCKSMAYSTGSQLIQFSQNGLPVRFPEDNNVLMHHKFLIIDSQSYQNKKIQFLNKSNKNNRSFKKTQPVLLTGSMNWTMQALSGNWDNYLITSVPALVNKFELEFEKLWIEFE